jgi:hypothetical protein
MSQQADRDGTPVDRAAAAGRGVVRRVLAAWRQLESAQRLAAYAALAMVVTMFLPWYSKSVTAIVTQGKQQSLASREEGLTAWAAFSFVEAATLLVAASVLVLLFRRGEGRAFHLPGGDGVVIAAAGVWAAFLIFYRFLDQPDGGTTATLTTDYGVDWGLPFALGSALFLASAGLRLRGAHLAEPPLPRAGVPAEDQTRVDASLQPTRVAPDPRPRARPATPPTVDGGKQLSFDEHD